MSALPPLSLSRHVALPHSTEAMGSVKRGYGDFRGVMVSSSSSVHGTKIVLLKSPLLYLPNVVSYLLIPVFLAIGGLSSIWFLEVHVRE